MDEQMKVAWAFLILVALAGTTAAGASYYVATGIAMHNQKGGVIENNLIEFNGGHVQFDHGVYADGDELTVQGNIVRHNASYGLHLYPDRKSVV